MFGQLLELLKPTNRQHPPPTTTTTSKRRDSEAPQTRKSSDARLERAREGPPASITTFGLRPWPSSRPPSGGTLYSVGPADNRAIRYVGSECGETLGHSRREAAQGRRTGPICDIHLYLVHLVLLYVIESSQGCVVALGIGAT